MGEYVGIFALHELDVVLGEFEWGFLEIHVARATWQHETEVYVDYVALGVDEDVVVMTIFYQE